MFTRIQSRAFVVLSLGLVPIGNSLNGARPGGPSQLGGHRLHRPEDRVFGERRCGSGSAKWSGMRASAPA